MPSKPLRRTLHLLFDERRPRSLAVSVFVVVLAGAMLGFRLGVPHTGVVTLWPPAGFTLGLLLFLPPQRWWIALTASMAGTAAAEALDGGNLGWVLAGAAANALESLCAAAVVRRFSRGPFTLGSVRQLMVLLIGGMLVANAITSIPGALVLTRGSLTDFGHRWLVWFIGDGLGMLVFTPLTVRGLRWISGHGTQDRRAAIEAVALAVLLVPLAYAVLIVSAPDGPAPWLPVYVLFPFLVWAAVRDGVFAVSGASAVLSVTLLVTLSHAPQVLAGPNAKPFEQELAIYLFIVVGTFSGLVPATLIEERQAADRRLRESERRFLDLANAIEESFFVVDLAPLRLSFGNAAALKMLTTEPGMPFDAARLLARVHVDDRETVRAQLRALLAGNIVDSTVRVPGAGGSWRHLRIRAYPAVAHDDGPQRITCVAADITALQHAEERLRHAAKMEAVGQFASGIVHDFNNLLSVTMLAADTLESDLPANSEARDEVAVIRGASDRGVQLARQLLRFSRQEPAARRHVSLHALARDIVPLLSRLIGGQVRFGLQLDATRDTVLADPSDIEQVLFNLCKNAADAMPGGGTLIVGTADAEVLLDDRTVPAVRLTVCDTGVGMDAGARARIFEPFYTTKAGGKGTGLGLATVQRIVDQHNGQIGVESAPNEGTTIVIVLPLATAERVRPSLETASSLTNA